MGKTLGERLKQLRHIRGWTLREVEQNTGISNGYLSQLENDSIKKPSPHFLNKLANAYKVPYESLLKLAGYLIQQKQSNPKASGTAFSLFKDLNSEEQEELLRYLEFLRSKAKKAK